MAKSVRISGGDAEVATVACSMGFYGCCALLGIKVPEALSNVEKRRENRAPFSAPRRSSESRIQGKSSAIYFSDKIQNRDVRGLKKRPLILEWYRG